MWWTFAIIAQEIKFDMLCVRSIMFHMKLFTLILAFILPCTLFADNNWLQLMPDQQTWFRVITKRNDCPSITIGEATYKMLLHAKSSSDIPLTSCKFVIPQSANSIQFENKTINLPKAFNKILIVGDTGCRIKGISVQDCHQDWPFEKIANISEKYKPDLIIHLGDYFYREFCLRFKCIGEPTGDNMKAWSADFFQPAQNLLNVAPWVMVRGNHESCSRGGNGWSHFFDYRNKCYKHTIPYTIDLDPKLRLIIADSADSDLLQEEINVINSLAVDNKQNWLLTHRPFWVKTNNGKEFLSQLQNLSSNISVILSGHIHTFHIAENSGQKQLIVGNSGSKLYEVSDFADDVTRREFGFTILDKQENDNWQLTAFNLNNEIIASSIIK